MKFGRKSITQAMLASALLIVILLVAAQPEASAGLGLFQRTLFWLAHVGLGIVAMFAASHLLKKIDVAKPRRIAAILICGIAGTLLVAPFYTLIDYLWVSEGTAESDGILDRFATLGLIPAIIVEFTEALPFTLPAWLMINSKLVIGVTGEENTTAVVDTPVEAELTDVSPQPECLAKVPGVFGNNVVAVSSDLHYLNVYTLIGKTTIPGNLRELVEQLGDSGIQVHRSHWVAHEYVARTVNSAGQMSCIMTNGLRIPVSRRRWKEVRAFYGQGPVQRRADPSVDSGSG